MTADVRAAAEAWVEAQEAIDNAKRGPHAGLFANRDAARIAFTAALDRLSATLATQAAELGRLRAACEPFKRDMHPLDVQGDFAPLTMTVTRGEMKELLAALRPAPATKEGEDAPE